jgi:tripartite-type tricarboxylate transporter receptor subunit TctC
MAGTSRALFHFPLVPAKAGTQRWIPACAGMSGGLALLATALVTSAVAQQSGVSFKDKQIRLIVGSAPGGGYDAYGRLIAAHMRRHLPDNPTIVVQNMPGAGSLVLANYLYNVAPKDGTAFGAVNALIATDPMMYPERVKFDPRQFRWLGSALKENHVGLSWHTSPVQSFDDMFKQELIVAGTGGATNLYPVLTNAILGTKIKMIPGYQGTKQGMLAMERGEVAGNIGITWASLKATAGPWLRDGSIKVLVQYGLEKHPELPGVSWIYDYAKNDEDRAAMDLSFGNQEFGRPFIAPPGVPDAVVNVMRTAFEKMMNDPEFRADAEKRQIDLDFTSGAEIQTLIDKFYKTPPAVVDRIKTILERTAQ